MHKLVSVIRPLLITSFLLFSMSHYGSFFPPYPAPPHRVSSPGLLMPPAVPVRLSLSLHLFCHLTPSFVICPFFPALWQESSALRHCVTVVWARC